MSTGKYMKIANVSILKITKANATRFSAFNEICTAMPAGDILEYLNEKDYRKLMR